MAVMSSAARKESAMKQLFLSFHGRMSRSSFWLCALLAWAVFVILFVGMDGMFSHRATLLLYPLLFWVLLALMTKRLHDRNKRGAWIMLVAVPIFGPLVLFTELGFLRGSTGDNRFGADPVESFPDYQTVR
jgi:uncharacterized membrane protein YhaH (DUF805 family)